MSGGPFKRPHVKCPFYREDDNSRKIVCEGIVEGSTITTTFKTKADMSQQMDIFCEDYYRNCEICRMLMEAKE